MSYIRTVIQKVIEFDGGQYPHRGMFTTLYAHITQPDPESQIQHALIAPSPRNDVMHLGEVDLNTGIYKHFDPDLKTPARYERSSNRVIRSVSVPDSQVGRLQTLDQLVTMEGFKQLRVLVPTE